MENFKSFIQSFGNFKKQEDKDPMAPSYIKADGTKVVEQVSELGKTVYEINPKGLLISRSYTPDGRLYFDYGRRANYEIGHSYDESGKVVIEIYSLYNEHNVMVRKTQTEFEYYDDGVKSRELITVVPSGIKTEILYDEKGERKEKIIYQGSVKTWYDNNDKPIKRQIDRGSGGIITEDL